VQKLPENFRAEQKMAEVLLDGLQKRRLLEPPQDYTNYTADQIREELEILHNAKVGIGRFYRKVQ